MSKTVSKTYYYACATILEIYMSWWRLLIHIRIRTPAVLVSTSTLEALRDNPAGSVVQWYAGCASEGELLGSIPSGNTCTVLGPRLSSKALR